MVSRREAIQARLEPLLQRAQTADRTALEELLVELRCYVQLLVRWRRGGPADDPDDSDLVQEVLVRVNRGLDRDRGGDAIFRGGGVGRFLGWVERIVRNVVIDERRRECVRPVTVDLSAAAERPDASAPPPEEYHEQVLILARALDGLPSHQRQVLLWRFFDGLSYEEISRRTGKSQPALRIVCSRAIERLGRDSLLERAVEGQRR